MNLIDALESRIFNLRRTLEIGPRPSVDADREATRSELRAQLAEAEHQLECARRQLASDAAAFDNLFARYGIVTDSPGVKDLVDLITAMAVTHKEEGFKFTPPPRLGERRDSVRLGEMHRRIEQSEAPRRQLNRVVRHAEEARKRAVIYRRRANGGPNLTEDDRLWPVTEEEALLAECEARTLREQAEDARKQLAKFPPANGIRSKAEKETKALISKLSAVSAAAAASVLDRHYFPSAEGEQRNWKELNARAAEAAADAFLYDPENEGDRDSLIFRQSFGYEAACLVYDAVMAARKDLRTEFASDLESQFDDSGRRALIGNLANRLIKIISGAFRAEDLRVPYSRWSANLKRRAEKGDIGGLPLPKHLADFLGFRQHRERMAEALLQRVKLNEDPPAPIAKTR